MWDDLRVLLEVHRRGSFLAAGTALGASTSTVARRVAALEKSYGPLVHRTSQGTVLESKAKELVKIAEGIEQSLTASKRDASPYAGVVRVSLPDGFSAGAAKALVAFQREHPQTLIELMAENRYVDLAAREADIGIRGDRSSSPVLIEKVLGDVTSGLYASEAYFARKLPSRVLSKFAEQEFVVAGNDRPTQWLMERGAVHFPFRSNAFAARLEAARGGAGLVLAAEPHPGLLPAKLVAPLPTLRFYLVMHKALRKVPRVAGVANALQEAIAAWLRTNRQ